MSGILTRTNIAAITFTDDRGNHIRVYYQDENGDIHETEFDEGAGWRSGPNDIVGTGGCINSGIAAVTFDGEGCEGRQIRLYYFLKGHHLTERCWSAATGWTDGDILKVNLVGTPTSSLAAISRNTAAGPEIRVYLQGLNGLLWQAFFLKSNTEPFHWAHGRINDLPIVPYGSTIAATYSVDGTHPRIITTNTENNIMIIASSDGKKWQVSNTIASGALFQIGAGIASIVIPVDGKPRFEVLATSVDNQLLCYPLGAVGAGAAETKPIVVASGLNSFSSVACFKLGNTTNLRVYFQPRPNSITEFVTASGGIQFAQGTVDVPVKQ